ncbi:hypothetical protein [Hydrogenoanaerobacterium sp.]|uniref:hypothetical protein n=1 Tax=Hydrogenoanaerobacterium sp. TaxID=2953763 RepID=UPI00289D8EEE|nr:hypothetical protein [Hydrogenoanaerobacterium sp.]
MKNKLKKICAISLAVALVGAQTVWALNTAKAQAVQPAEAPLTETATAAENKTRVSGGTGLSKDESVYVLLNNDGSVRKQIVSSWLHSDIGLAGVHDISILKDIKNLKSAAKPEFKDGKLSWNTNDKDVYYQGTTGNPLPINVTVTYKLDGKGISAEELAGKSGEVEIRIKVTNAYTETQVIDGVERPIAPMFLTAVLLNLPDENFSNVKAEDGMIMNESTNQLVTFVTVPGLKESFEGLLDDEIGNIKDKMVDEFVVTAFAEEFRLPSIMIGAANDSDLFDDDNDLESDIDDLLDDIDDLNDATDELHDGTIKLADAGVEFNDNMRTFRSKYRDFQDGFKEAYKAINGLVGKLNGIQDVVSHIPPAQLGALKQGLAGLQANMYSPEELQLLQALCGKDLGAELNGFTQKLSETVGLLLGRNTGFVADPADRAPDATVDVPNEGAKTETGTTADTPKDETKTDAKDGAQKDEEIGADAGTDTPKEDAKTDAGIETDIDAATSKDADAKNNDTADKQGVTALPDQAAGFASAVEMKFSGTENTQSVRVLGDYVQAPQAFSAPALTDNQIKEVQGAIGQAVQGMLSTPEMMEKLRLAGEVQVKSKALLESYTQVMTAIEAIKADPQFVKALERNPEIAAMLKNPSNIPATLQKLSSGSGKLMEGLDKLYEGQNKIGHAIDDLKDATQELQDKTAELNDGVEEFQIDGIYELTGRVTDLTDEIKQALHIKEAISDASKGFTTYTGAPADADTSVKFIMKTDEIKTKEEVREVVTIEEQKTGFWDKVKALFRK